MFVEKCDDISYYENYEASNLGNLRNKYFNSIIEASKF